MMRRTPIFIALLALLAMLYWQTSTPPIDRQAPRPTSPTGIVKAASPDIFAEFDATLAQTAPSAPVSPELIELARQRAKAMRALIASQPEEALARAISWSTYQQLAAPLRPHVERPFNTLAHLHALPICDARPPNSPAMIYQVEIRGESFAASPVGRTAELGSKEDAPLSGIILGSVAAVRGSALELLSPEDAVALEAVPLANPYPARCFATGEPLPDGQSVALLGGKRLLFSDATTAIEFGQKLDELDDSPSPHAGSRMVFELADGEPGKGFDWDAAGELVQNEASTWTETPKDVLFIRIDFSDVPGEATSQGTLESALATSSASIVEQSYGKTSLNSTVSSVVVRMPSPSTSYLPNLTSDLHNDAKDAYEALYGSGSLAAYDIIGVHFASIGIASSSGTIFSGLAGGSRQWLQSTTNPNTIIHEFGHNYGIGHASFWDTSDGTVVGAGTSSEYGDPFDIMGGGPDPEGHFHMQGKSKLNWIETTQWVDADSEGSGTYRIHRIDHEDTTGTYRGIRALKAADEYYWLGYRTGILGNSYLENGAYLVWQRPGFSRSWLLDTTPDSAPGKEDAALAVGTTYSDAAAGVHFTPVATGGSGPDAWLDLTVNLGSFPSNASPTVAISGASAADARAPVTFSANASDPDGDDLAYSWDFGDSSTSTNASSVTKTWVSGGTYTVSVTVSDMKGGTTTDSLSVTVSDPINNWTERTSGVTADLYDIATDGTQLVVVGASSGTYLTSTDGSSWSGGVIDSNVRLRGMIYDGTQFVAAGYDYDFPLGRWLGVIYTSPDGTSWTNRFYDSEELRDIAYGDGNYVAVGDAGTIWHSTDAITWNPIASGTSEGLDGVSFGDSTFVIAGSGSGGGPVVVLTSTDGLAWTDQSAGAGTASWQGFYDIEFCNDRFLASGWYSKIRHSTDAGQSFSTTRSTTEQIPAFAHGNGVYLAAGVDKGNSDADLNLISTDGENWTPLVTADQEVRNAAIFFEDTFITVGNDGAIWQSDSFSAPPVGGFASWLATNFPAGSSATADPDGDGITNAAEYANATDPNDGTDAAHPISGTSGDYLTLTVAKNPNASDVTYTVQTCSDLASWTTVGTTIVSETDTELVVRTSAVPDPVAFLRVLYTIP